MSKRDSQTGVSQETRRQARRQLVVLLSAPVFLLLPLYPIAILVAKLSIWFGLGPTLDGVDVLVFIIVFSMMFLIGATISSIIWMLIMSFYLTVEEWRELDRDSGLYIPVLTPLFTRISYKILTWKISREK